MQTQRKPCAIALGLVLLATFFSACTSDDARPGSSGQTVSDTLGNRFDVTCGGGYCGLSPWDIDLKPVSCSFPPSNDAFVLVMDPLLSIYALRVPQSGALQLDPTNPSRPVACTTDADCLAPGISTGIRTYKYACANGLCRSSESNGGTELDMLMTYDVLTLCQADIPWPSACPYITSQPFASRIPQVADLCGQKDYCGVVPASCRQPDAPIAPAIDGGVPVMPTIDGGPPVGPGMLIDGGA